MAVQFWEVSLPPFHIADGAALASSASNTITCHHFIVEQMN